MDFPCTQIIADENECSSSNTLNHSSQYQGISRKQVGTLTVGPLDYPIYCGVNTIGRDPASNIPIADSTVSKRHSEIEASLSQAPAWICDLNSSNKTRLNNAVLRPGRYYELKEDSAIYFGRVRATYRYHQALNESAVAETPVVDRRRKPLEEKVVAETPDSSLNNSSGLAGDVSAIPATQDFQSTFRTPPLPHQQQPVQSVASTSVLTSSPKNASFAEATSSTSDRNICPDSDDEVSTCEVSSRNESLGQTTSVQQRKDFLPDSDDEANISETETQQREQPVTSITSTLPATSKNDSSVATISRKAPPDYPSSSKGISIHDMETQQPEELIDSLRASATNKLPRNCSKIQSDIHDMETQIDDFVVNDRKKSSIMYSPRNYSPDRNSERQEKNSIYDMETQKPEEIIDHARENASRELPSNHGERQIDIHDMETQQEDLPVNTARKRLIVHSPTNCNPDSNSEPDKQVSIYDLETQKPFQVGDGQVLDIHDMETQNLFLDHASKSQTNLRTEIPINTDTIKAQVDNEEISSRESQANAENIYEKETQCTDDVALIMSSSPSISPEQNHTPSDKVISTTCPHESDRQSETNNDCTSQMVTQEINNENVNSEIEKSTSQKSKNEQAVADSFNKDVESKNNTTVPESLDEPSSPPQELLKLSLEANFEEDCKELDVSVSNVGSQNLLENLAVEEVQKHLSMTSPDRSSSAANEELDQYAASSEDDIFNAVTQKAPADEEDIFNAATQRVNLKKSKDLESDGSETDEEGVFKNIVSKSAPLVTKNTETNSKVDKITCNKDKEGVLRLDTCETQKIDMNKSDERQPDINADNDDDSITDEEGVFTQFIAKTNDTSGRTSTVEENVSRQENDNYCHSRDSGDIYDLPTQPIKLSGEETTNFSNVITENDDENKELDETVTIQRKTDTFEDNVTPIKIKDAVEKAVAQPAYNTDDIAPTQLIHVPTVESPTDGPSCNKTNESVGEILAEKKSDKLETVSDIDDMAPTQIIRVLSNESPLSNSADFEMAEIQPGNLEGGNISPVCSKENQIPQERKLETPTSEIISGIDDLGPTQIIRDPNNVSPLNNPAGSLILENDPSKSKGGYTSDMDILPTQMIQVPKTHDCDDLSDGYSSDASGLYSAQKCGIEDIEYEMAPTQLIGEVDDEQSKKATDAKKIKKGSVRKTRGKSIRKAKVNLDDTIERNLNNMFDGVNTEDVQEPPMLSTQSLQNLLEPSQEKLLESPASSSSKVKSNSKVKQSSRQAKTTANENTDSQNSENYFSIMKSIRKRNVFGDSQDSTDLESKKDLADEKVEGKDAIVDEVETGSVRERSAQKTSADAAQICDIKDVKETQETESLLAATDEGNVRDGGNNDEIEPLLTVNDLFDEYSIPKISESLVRTSIIIDDDEVDIMSGLPEVRIAGTSSNPPSPTSSVSTRSDISTLPKRNATKSTVKKASKSRARRGNVKRNVVSANSEKQSNSFSESLGIGDVLIKKQEEHDKENTKSYRVTRRSAMKEDVKDPSKAIVLLERLLLDQYSIALTSSQKDCLRDSPKDLLRASFARTTTSRRSSQENDDCSSVFQVAKEVEGVNGSIKASKQNSKPVSLGGKRSLRKRVENEQIDTKISNEAEPEAKVRKRKNSDSKEDMDIPNKARRNSIKNAANTRQSPTIRDFFPKRDSPLTIERPQSPVPFKEKPKRKKSVGNTSKSVANTKTASIDTNPPETANGATRRKAASSKRSLPNDEGQTQFVKNGRSTLLQNLIPNIHPAFSEESQEVEMILSRSTLESKAKVEIKNEEPPKQETKGRRGRKRLNPIEIKSNNIATEARVVSNKTSLSDDIGEAQIAKMHTSTPQRRSSSLRKSISNQSTLSEKSQDVETPLTRSTLESKGNEEVNVKNEEAPKQVTKGRRGRKRLNPNESKNSDKKGNNTSSEVSTSEPPSFEVPVSRPKRAKMSNMSITSVDEPSLDESKKSTRSSRYSQRSLANSSNDLSTSTTSQSSQTKMRQKILFTGITNTDQYSNILTKLGASQVDEITKCTVLVTDKVRRTVKFLCALAQATPIVSVDWLIESDKMGQFLDIEEYILSDQQSEKKFGFELRKSLQKAQSRKLLESYTVVLTPNVAQPPISELKSLISACGGKPLIRPPAKLPEKTVIISNEADMANARKFLAKAPKGVTVQSTEFLLSGILQQELNFTKYKLI